MQKRVLLGAGVILVIAIATGGIFVASKKSISIQNFSPQTASVPSPTPTPQSKLLTWTDPAGFAFQYPEGMTINPHKEDNDSYAHVELTSNDHPGNLIVWAKDTNSADITAWVRTEKTFAGSPTLDTSLGGQPAKKVIVTGSERFVTGSISDELLFMIDTKPTDKAYWTGMHEQVANSFTFAPAPASAGAGSGEGGADAADEEETVQ